MDEEHNAWDQMLDEKTLWYDRFVIYLRMGAKRSVNAVFRKEQRSARNREKPRVLDAGGDWYEVEKEWKWKERAKSYDDHLRAEEDRIIAEERAKVLRRGYALMHKRVQDLDKLTRKLIGYTSDEERIWLPDVKSIQKSKEVYERVDLVNFNAPLFTLIDKYMASLAAELGERVKKQEVTGKDGGAIEVEVIETFWGRGTDPRKAISDDVPQEVQSEAEDPEISVEFGIDDEAGE